MQEIPKPPPSPLEIVGPFDEFRVVWDGYVVPHLSARPLDNGLYDVMVDNRFLIHRAVSRDDLENWMPILANAMAVAAGHSSHGENCQPLNRFKQAMGRIGGGQPNLSIVQPGPEA